MLTQHQKKNRPIIGGCSSKSDTLLVWRSGFKGNLASNPNPKPKWLSDPSSEPPQTKLSAVGEKQVQLRRIWLILQLLKLLTKYWQMKVCPVVIDSL